MSFFANLLGGTMQGIGAGMSAMGADEERLAQQRALIQDRQQGALELQRQRAEDRLYQQQEMAALRGGAGGGAGKGGDFNLERLLYDAETPEQQQKAIRLTRTYRGDDAARLVADQMFGKPEMTGTAASPGDFARYDRAGDMEATPPTSTMERAAYDAEQGRQALARLSVFMRDPAKTDDYAKAERQFGLNDMGAANAAQVMQRGGSLPEASGAFQKYSGAKDESGKEDLAQQRIDATNRRTDATTTNAGANRQAQDARALDRQIAGAYKQLGEARPKDKPALQTRIQEMEARRDAMDGAALAPALNNYQPGSTAQAPSPTSVLPKPRSPADAAKAFQYQPGSFLKKP